MLILVFDLNLFLNLKDLLGIKSKLTRFEITLFNCFSFAGKKMALEKEPGFG